MWWLLACSAVPSSTGPFKFTAAGKVSHPTAIEVPKGDPDAVYVVEQEGRIWRLAGGQQTVALDVSASLVSGGEMGLLGLAFAPTWPKDPRIFVNYTYGSPKDL